jgi:hypothetical protein
MRTATLDHVLDTFMQLPAEQQEMLLDILHSRYIEYRRRQIAENAKESLTAFRAGKLKPQSADEIIIELHRLLFDKEE